MHPIIEKLQEGFWVYGIHPEIGELLQTTEDMCFRLNSLPPGAATERNSILKEMLGSLGKNHCIHSPFRCDFGKYIHIGDNFTSNFGLTILDEAPVMIGDRVFIGPNVSIFTINHALLPQQRSEGVMNARPVEIGDDVWLCGGVIVLPGARIGNGCVVAAGSVVRGELPPMHLCAGNPCRPIREITASDRIEDVVDVRP